MGLRIFITGNLGFVGSETTRLLTAEGHTTIGYDLMNACDIRDEELLEKAIVEFKPQRILHLAAIARFADSKRDQRLAYSTNVLGTQTVARVAAKYHLPVVYSSTGSVYMPIEQKPPITEEFEVEGNSTYALTKRLGEIAIMDMDSPWIILRYAHIYGSEKRGHGLVGGFMERIQRGLAPVLYGGKQSNDFVYIKDIARANMLALTASWDKWNQIYNIGTGEELSAEEAGEAVCEVMKYDGKIEQGAARTVDPERFLYDCSKAERMLGFKAQFSFREGLEDMMNGSPSGEELPS